VNLFLKMGAKLRNYEIEIIKSASRVLIAVREKQRGARSSRIIFPSYIYM